MRTRTSPTARRPRNGQATRVSTSSYDLVLPKRKTLRRKLEIKLKEYREREQSANCKRTILEMLLKRGRVNWNAMERRFGEDNADLYNAFRVIRDYVTTGGENVTGGSLPK